MDVRDRAPMIIPSVPRKVLILSADIGDGHNAAARAIGECVERTWAGCGTKRVDALRVIGRWASWLFRSVYHFEINRAPWIYQFFYDALWRHPWFARAAKRLTGSLCGRRLAHVIKRFDPDLIISTYPIASAGLHWLRRHRGLGVPTCTFITDFAAHPFWVFQDVDVHCVMHELSVPDVIALGVRGDVRVAAPPVRSTFRSRDPALARSRLGLRPDSFVALVTGGAWGVGELEDAVRGLLDGGERFQVVVVCGRNEGLVERLRALGFPRERLVPIGFTDAMADLMASVDVVITNAGGITSLEAFAANRPLVLFCPIAGHGKANAALMERAGLAIVCANRAELLEVVRRLDGDEVLSAQMRSAQRLHLTGKRLESDLAEIARVRPPAARSWPETASRLGRIAVAATLTVLLSGEGSLFIGTRFARAARGAPRGTNEAAIVIAGSLPPNILDALMAEARSARIPLTFFVEGKDAVAAPQMLRELAGNGFEVEAGTWSTSGRWSIEVGDLRAQLAQTVAAIHSATGVRPAYFANPGGRVSLLAVAVTDQLRLRRVVFEQAFPVGTKPTTVPSVKPGAIVELRVWSSATPEGAVAALQLLAEGAAVQGLTLVTVVAIDHYSAGQG
jgi:UDP-N-acetylglucosamine:LPS N-acetylglucosamine transferase